MWEESGRVGAELFFWWPPGRQMVSLPRHVEESKDQQVSIIQGGSPKETTSAERNM